MIKYLLLSLLFIYNAFAYQQYGESGALLSPMGQTSRDTLTPKVPGVIIYNTDTEEYNYWNGILWNQIGSGGAGGASVRNWFNANTISATNSTNNLAVPNFTVVEPGNLFNISECGTITNDSTDGLSINVAKNSLIIVTLNSADIGATYTSGISINPTAAELDASFSSLPPEKQGCKTETISNGSNSQSCTFSKMTRATDVLYVHTEPGLTYTNNPNFSIRVTCFADWSEAYPIAEWKTGTEYKANQLLNGGIDKNWILKVEQNHTSGDIDLDMNSGKLLALSPPIITTGLQNGGDATLAGNVATVQAGAGYIATYAGSVSPYPLIKSVEWTTQTVTLPATGIHTLMIDVNGLLFSIPGLGTTQQATENISVGIVDMNLGKVYDRETYPTNPVGQLQSLSLFLGAMTKGLNYTGTGLTLNRSQHSFYFWGTDSKDHYDPNVRVWPALSPLPFFEFTQTGPVAPVVLKTSVKTDVKDIGGTLVPMSNNKWGFFRIYMSLGEEDYIMYSQADYPGEAEAIEAAVASSFIRPTSLDLSKFAGYVTYQKGDTNLADNKFVTCEPFGCDKIGSGGGGSGNVVGPASSVDSNLIAFDGITGKLIKDSGIPMANVVQGPATAVADSVATFNGTTGKLIKDSGILTSTLGDVKGPAIAVDSNVTAFDTTTGKLIKDSGIAVANLGDVKGPAIAVDSNVTAFDTTTGKLIKDSGIAVANLGDVKGPASAIVNNVATFDSTTGKLIKDSLIPITSITQQTGNYIPNPDVEQGLVGYVGIGTLNTTNPLQGLKSLNLDTAALNDFAETALITIPPVLMGNLCMIKVSIRGGDANLQLQLVNGAGTVVGFKQLEVNVDPATRFITFNCPKQVDINTTPALGQLKIKVTQSTATNAALATLDNFYLGEFESNTMNVQGQVEELTANTLSYTPASSGKLDWSNVIKNTVSTCGTVTITDATNRFTYTGKKSCLVNVTCGVVADNNEQSGASININGTALSRSFMGQVLGASGMIPATLSAVINAGDVLICTSENFAGAPPTSGAASNLILTATPLPQLATIVSTNQMRAGFYGLKNFTGCSYTAVTGNSTTGTDFAGTGCTAPSIYGLLNPGITTYVGFIGNKTMPNGFGTINLTSANIILTGDAYLRLYNLTVGAFAGQTLKLNSGSYYGGLFNIKAGDDVRLRCWSPTNTGTCNIAPNLDSLFLSIFFNPDLSDPYSTPELFAVLPSQTQYLENNLTLYVATTGSDSSGDGTAGKPFATPQAALDYLGRYTFAPGVEVLISVAAGQYILTSSIVPQHPQGAQITIQGATVTTPPVAADFCTPGTIPARGWSNPTAAQRETCANTDLTMLRGKYPTELRFIRVAGVGNDIDGIKASGYTFNISNFLLTSNYLPSTNITSLGIGISTNNGGAINYLGPIAIHGFVYGLVVQSFSLLNGNSTLSFSNNKGDAVSTQGNAMALMNGEFISSNNGGIGLYGLINASIWTGACTIKNNGNFGLLITRGSVANLSGNFTATNNGNSGVVSSGSMIEFGGSVTSNNNNNTSITSSAGTIFAPGSISTLNNIGDGILAKDNGVVIVGSGITSNNNSSFGLSSIGGRISSGSTATSANTAGGLYAEGMGVIKRGIDGGNQSYSPALSVFGNNNGYIYP